MISLLFFTPAMIHRPETITVNQGDMWSHTGTLGVRALITVICAPRGRKITIWADAIKV